MDKFQIVKNCGDGTYGTVVEAINKTTRETVAIKKMKRKFESWDEAMSLREVKTLRRLNHKNVIKLKEVIRVQSDVFLVFELMKGTILDHIRDYKRFRGAYGLPSDQIKSLMKQLLVGLAFIHERGYFHRDMKPENILYQDGVLKIADFGLSKEYEKNQNQTNYVSTRWYRAPEIMLRQKRYDQGIDVFAAGCIFAEMFSGQPLFPGSSETDMVHRISRLIGCVPNSWKEGFSMACQIGLTNIPGALVEPSFDQVTKSLQNVLPAAPPAAIDLILRMITWDPKQRPNCNECLKHPFFGTRASQSSFVGKEESEMRSYKESTLQRMAQNQEENTKVHKQPIRSENISTIKNFNSALDLNLIPKSQENTRGTLAINQSPCMAQEYSLKASNLREHQHQLLPQPSNKRSKQANPNFSINGNNIVFQYQEPPGGYTEAQAGSSLTSRYQNQFSQPQIIHQQLSGTVRIPQSNFSRASNRARATANLSPQSNSIGRNPKPHLLNKQLFVSAAHQEQPTLLPGTIQRGSHHHSLENLGTRPVLDHRNGVSNHNGFHSRMPTDTQAQISFVEDRKTFSGQTATILLQKHGNLKSSRQRARDGAAGRPSDNIQYKQVQSLGQYPTTTGQGEGSFVANELYNKSNRHSQQYQQEPYPANKAEHDPSRSLNSQQPLRIGQAQPSPSQLYSSGQVPPQRFSASRKYEGELHVGRHGTRNTTMISPQDQIPPLSYMHPTPLRQRNSGENQAGGHPMQSASSSGYFWKDQTAHRR